MREILVGIAPIRYRYLNILNGPQGVVYLVQYFGYRTFLTAVGVVVEELSWLLTLLLSELLSSSGSLLPDLTPRTSGRPELCRILQHHTMQVRKNSGMNLIFLCAPQNYIWNQDITHSCKWNSDPN